MERKDVGIKQWQMNQGQPWWLTGVSVKIGDGMLGPFTEPGATGRGRAVLRR